MDTLDHDPPSYESVVHQSQSTSGQPPAYDDIFNHQETSTTVSVTAQEDNFIDQPEHQSPTGQFQIEDGEQQPGKKLLYSSTSHVYYVQKLVHNLIKFLESQNRCLACSKCRERCMNTIRTCPLRKISCQNCQIRRPSCPSCPRCHTPDCDCLKRCEKPDLIFSFG